MPRGEGNVILSRLNIASGWPRFRTGLGASHVGLRAVSLPSKWPGLQECRASSTPTHPLLQRRPAAAKQNDVTAREAMWRRFDGDDWASFDQLPTAIRRRLHEHAYDAWAVNALMLWRRFRRTRASSAQAERALLRYLDECEVLERTAFAASYSRAHGMLLPHIAAGATVMRYLRPPSIHDCGLSNRERS